MTYKIATGDDNGRATYWWAKFLAYAFTASDDYDIQVCLDRHNSHAVLDPNSKIGDEIEFRSIEDFTIFKIKWS